MHPLALISYPRGVAVTRSRSRRRRTRRAVIAVVVGLLGAGSGQALADAPHQHLPGSHANVHQRITPAPPGSARRAPANDDSLDAWPAAAVIGAVAVLLGAVGITRRHRLPTAT